MKTPKTHSKIRRAPGFTLIELMVSMGITAIIVTVLVTITGVATDTWTRSRSEIRASRQAKSFIDTMAKDFESMVSRRGNDFEWLHAELDNSGLPAVTRDQSGTTEAAALTFMTAATDRYLGQIGEANDNGGDISCVSYRLRYQDPISCGSGNDDTSTFVLYRLLKNPDVTFEELLGQEDLKTAFQPFVSEIDEEENFICENVHQFSVTFLVEIQRTSGGETVPETVRVSLSSDSSAGEFTVTGTGVETDLTASGATAEELEAGRLRAVEISISVLSDAGMVRMNAGDGLTADDYARNVYHFSRVVEVPGM
jgi:prepilin-type N-terminal cleavage/methylation domain-containing protein